MINQINKENKLNFLSLQLVSYLTNESALGFCVSVSKKYSTKPEKKKKKSSAKSLEQILEENRPSQTDTINKFKTIMKNFIRWADDEKNYYFYTGQLWRRTSTNEISNMFSEFLKKENLSFMYTITICSKVLHKFKTEEPFFLKTWPVSSHLPFLNGILDIATLKLMPHNFLEYNKFILNFVWISSSVTTSQISNIYGWLQFITNNNTNLVEFICILIYRIIIGKKGSYFLYLLGPGGSGKSTLITLIIALLGRQNTFSTSLTQLEKNRFETGALMDKKFVTINDSEQYTGDLSILKQMTGSDGMRFELKFKQPIEKDSFPGFIAIVSNHILKVRDDSGYSRRIMPLVLPRTVRSSEMKILIETRGDTFFGTFVPELPYFIAYLLNQYSNMDTDLYMNNVFENVPELKEMRDNILKGTNPLYSFIDEHILFLENSYIPRQSQLVTRNDIPFESLYDLYHNFNVKNYYKSLNISRFTERFVDTIRFKFQSNTNNSKTHSFVYFNNIALKYIIKDKTYYGIYLDTYFKTYYIIELNQISFQDFKLEFERLNSTQKRLEYINQFLVK